MTHLLIAPFTPLLLVAPPPFEPYGMPHVLVLLLTVAVPALLALIVRSKRVEDRVQKGLRWGFAAALIILQIGKVLYTTTHFDSPWTHFLPLHLCDLVLFCSAWALVTRQQWAFVLAYFWGLAGTMQGLLTPDLGYGFPHPYFFFFFFQHGGIVAAALFLVWGFQMRPRARDILYAWGGILTYALVVYFANVALGTNFGYLNARPNVPSLLDYFWDPPAHIAQMAVVALLFFLILYLPFALANTVHRRRARRRLDEEG